MHQTRRTFISQTAGMAAAAWAGGIAAGKLIQTGHAFKVQSAQANFEREPLIKPFGFKGGYLSELWQTSAKLTDPTGNRAVGLGTQSVLWSDSSIFKSHTESGGNALMFLLLERALKEIAGTSFKDPIHLLDSLIPTIHDYGKTITRNQALRETFVLNALVPLDNAAWLLSARSNGLDSFDQMIPTAYRTPLAHRHKKVARVPLISYGVGIDDLVRIVDEGHFFLKIKIGQPGTQNEMLEKDQQRIEAIHKAIGSRRTPHTKDGRIPYYFDANGRYEKKETLLRLLDHAEKIGARDRIVLLEEPFPESADIHVGDLGIRIAADESAHTDRDVVKRIQMGYRAIAVKGIAKTLSMTLKILKVAHENKIPCFCADLTVNPILVDWHKNLAARMAPLPELDIGILETNGHQNYKNWDKMMGYHPAGQASWTKVTKGLFNLDEAFFKKSGGIFEESPHYERLYP